MKFEAKKIVSWAGTLLMVVSLAFIVHRLAESGIDFSLLASPWIVPGLFAVGITDGIGVLLASLNYRALIRNVSGVSVPAPFAVKIYANSNMYKYIPGGIMYALGRNRLAVENEALTHGKVFAATALEGVFIGIGALTVTSLFAFEHIVAHITATVALPTLLISLAVLLALVAPLVYLLRRRISALLKRLDLTINKGAFSLPILANRLGFAVALAILWGLSFLATLALLGHPLALGSSLTIIGLFAMSWLLGFLTPGAPSGLGIREMVMLMFMDGVIYEPVLLSAIVTHRALNVVGDVLSLCAAHLYAKVRGSNFSLTQRN